MPDTSGHDATRPDNLHTMSARELAAKIAAAGLVMSYRQVIRHCKAGTFDAAKIPAANNIENWFVAPSSVEKGIADIRALQEQRLRHDATRHDVSDSDASEKPTETNTDTSGHDATRPDMSHEENQSNKVETQQDMTRHVPTTDLDVYEHPYVKRLEERCERLENKLDAQVRRTEEIQRDSQKQLIELQRMTAVGNSQTLADFMLKAKDWILGPATASENKEVTDGTIS
jgi:predicted RNase H-like nuclease (RuvC/YqgF family)